jgi:hypothetical protein
MKKSHIISWLWGLALGGLFVGMVSNLALGGYVSPVGDLGKYDDPLKGGISIPVEQFQEYITIRNQTIREQALKQGLIRAINETKYNAEEHWQKIINSFIRAAEQVSKQRKSSEAASPRMISGNNPDGSRWYQFSARLDVFHGWIKEIMQGFGLLSKWKGESFEDLLKKFSHSEFQLTFNKHNTVYFGNNRSIIQRSDFQFSLTGPEGFEEYTQSRTHQPVWDSLNNREEEIVLNTITDNMVWQGKPYEVRDDDNRVESKRQLISSRQRTWDEKRNKYTETTVNNVYSGNFPMPIKSERHVLERALDEAGNTLDEREYDIVQENMVYEWIATGDPISGGSYELKTWNQTLRDSSTPKKITFSHHENTFKDGQVDNQLVITHETGPGLDNTFITVERYLEYDPLGQQVLRQYNTSLEGNFPDFDTALERGRALRDILDSDLKSGLENSLKRSLDLSLKEDLNFYSRQVNKALEMVLAGKTLNKALEEVIASSGEEEEGISAEEAAKEKIMAQTESNKATVQSLQTKSPQSKKKSKKTSRGVCKKMGAKGCEEYEKEEIEAVNSQQPSGEEEITGMRITFSHQEKKYNDKGFLAWEKQEMVVRGHDQDGTELEFSRSITRTFKDFTPFGLPTEIEEVEIDKDKITTSFISRQYNEDGRVIFERSEVQVKSKDGLLDYHYTISREGFEYDEVGRATHYTTMVNSEVTPDVQTITDTWLKYNERNQITWQKTETWEQGPSLNRHIVNIRENIVYNDIGLEVSYTDFEEEFDASGQRIGNRLSEVSNITYNQDGLQTGYDMRTLIEGTDPNSATEMKITTDTQVRDIEYNNVGMRITWKETTIDSRRGAGLSSERVNTITEIDRFGRIVRMEIKEHSYGESSDGKVIDTERQISRHVLSHNGRGQEETVEEIVEEDAKTTTSTSNYEYDEYGRINYEEKELNITADGLDQHLKIVRYDIEYNEAGLETAYVEFEEEFDISGTRIGNSLRETTNITYNENGQQTGYDMMTTVEGEDSYDGSSFTIVTEAQVRNLEYNEVGVRMSWSDTTIDSTRPALTTERNYKVANFDEFGRITEMEIEEASYGQAEDGSVLDTSRIITREITYNPGGREATVTETVEEGSKITISTIEYEYDEYGRIRREVRDIYVSGEDEGVVLDYSSTMIREDFEYNDAGLVQFYRSEITNESTPDLKIIQEVELGYNPDGLVDYQRTETREKGISSERSKYGEKTGNEENVDRHTISIKHDIVYNEIGLETYYVNDEQVWEDGELTRDATETVYDITYDSKGRLTSYTTHKVGSEKITDEESEKFGEWQDVNTTTEIYNITYIDGLDLRKSWEEYITGTINGQNFEPSWRYYEVLEFDRFGDVIDIHVEGDGVEEEDQTGTGEEGQTQSQGIGPQGGNTSNTASQAAVKTKSVKGIKAKGVKRPAKAGTLKAKEIKSLKRNPLTGELEESEEEELTPVNPRVLRQVQ